MFVLCLDDASPDNESQVIHFTLTGDYKCRWPDKSLNMVMFENGVPGGICDVSYVVLNTINIEISYNFTRH